MLTTAKARLAATINTVYPTHEAAGRIGHPDDQIDVLTLLRADPESVVLLHSPQLAVAGAVSTFACSVSVCALTENAALAAAQPLLAHLLPVSAVNPTPLLAPIATVLSEDGWWRVAVGFTLRIKA